MSKPKIRCAVYTRKSTEEGLDQDFNSLDAQHEACAAYVASQKHEGWKILPTRYDDGGISGGTLERPALQNLLSDIDAGRVDMVVVYKIDRLTRSLADFAKLVDLLEQANCSFVSVTQAFNTSSSMGRLTLNVLLSFAQFEREVTAERIRDKIAASKKKGLWMGGLAPLGYDPHPDKTRREFVVNTAEAKTVQRLFQLYLEQGCLNATAAVVEREGLRSKYRIFKNGRTQGGTVLSRGQIHAILTNPTYRGMIRHKGQTFDGQHEAIIDDDLWDKVQKRLQSASARRRGSATSSDQRASAPLKGKLRDETGDLLTPTHTMRHGKRQRYYFSNRLISGGVDPTGWRLPAKTLEQTIIDAIADHLRRLARNHNVLGSADASTAATTAEAVAALVEGIRTQGCNRAAPFIRNVAIEQGALTIHLNTECLAASLELDAQDMSEQLHSFTTSFSYRRRGVELKIVAGDPKPQPDQTLIKGLRHAHEWSEALRSREPQKALAQRVGHSERYIRRITSLIALSPKLQAAILEGTQVPHLNLETLVRGHIPLDWAQQDLLFGPNSSAPC